MIVKEASTESGTYEQQVDLLESWIVKKRTISFCLAHCSVQRSLNKFPQSNSLDSNYSVEFNIYCRIEFTRIEQLGDFWR